jgi:acetamidase/formamidase
MEVPHVTCAAAGHGDGVHVLTGPIYMCGAQPGDVLQVWCPHVLQYVCGGMLLGIATTLDGIMRMAYHTFAVALLQVDILNLEPRINPSTGKTYGSNAAASWGAHS